MSAASGAAPVGAPPRVKRSRDDVVAVAGRLFAARGFHGTSMRELGEALGLLGSSLYAHIGSKDELLVEIIGEGAALFQALADEVAQAGGDPADQLRRLVAGHIRIVVDNRDRAATYLNEDRHLPDPERLRAVELRDRYEASFRRVIEAGVEAGRFREGLDPGLAATFVLSLLNATDRWYRADGALTPEELADAMYDFIVRGLS